MENYIIAGVLILILGGAGAYVYKAKKRGVKCIGCPAGGECSHKCDGASGCACSGECGNHCSCNETSKNK